jgi:hypothetical protein
MYELQNKESSNIIIQHGICKFCFLPSNMDCKTSHDPIQIYFGKSMISYHIISGTPNKYRDNIKVDLNKYEVRLWARLIWLG